MWRRVCCILLALLTILTLSACKRKKQPSTETPTPESSAAASKPQPSVTPKPKSTAAPEPTVTPKPKPTVTPKPKTTAAPTPKPKPTPKPSAAPSSSPSETPIPTATPAATRIPSAFAPKITKQPSSEGHFVNESAVFVTQAENWTTLHWTAVSPSGREIDIKTFRETFPGSTVTGENETTLTITNLNLDMSGWSFYCTFENDQETAVTDSARLKVTAQESTGSGSGSTGSRKRTLRCMNCGEEIDREDIICPSCGKSVFHDNAIVYIDNDGNISYIDQAGTMYFDKSSRTSTYEDYNANYAYFNDNGLIISGNYVKDEQAAEEQAIKDAIISGMVNDMLNAEKGYK